MCREHGIVRAQARPQGLCSFHYPALAGVPARGGARAWGSGSRAKGRPHMGTSRSVRRAAGSWPGHTAALGAGPRAPVPQEWRHSAFPLECRLSPRRSNSQKREHVHSQVTPLRTRSNDVLLSQKWPAPNALKKQGSGSARPTYSPRH